MNCKSIVLRQVVPNGARVGEGFQLLFQQEWKGRAERRAYLRNSFAARAASHRRLSDGKKWLGPESAISFQLNSQTLVCRPLGEFSVTV